MSSSEISLLVDWLLSMLRAECGRQGIDLTWPSFCTLKLARQLLAELERKNLDTLAEHYGLSGDEYFLSPLQVQAILDLKLHRLTAMEQTKLVDEYKEILAVIQELRAILNDDDKLTQVIRDELLLEQQNFGDKRLTEIVVATADIDIATD